MPVSPADVIAGTLRRAGVPQADIHAKAIAADLAGHGLLYETNRRSGTKRSTEPPVPKCQNPDAPGGPHISTALVGGRCPICGWNPENHPNITTGA